jgi:hypothetical protein
VESAKLYKAWCVRCNRLDWNFMRRVCFGLRIEGENPCVYLSRPIEVVPVRWIGGVVLLIPSWFA